MLEDDDVDLGENADHMYRSGAVYVGREPPRLGTPEHEEYIAWLRDQFSEERKSKTKYRPEMCAQARKLFTKGWIDVEVAEFLEVHVETLRLWRAQYSEFAEACKLGKAVVDDRVEEALVKRALGYELPSEKVHFDKDGNVSRAKVIEHIPPDPKAAMNWLKNRRPDKWKDRREVTGADGAPLHPVGQPRQSKIEIARRVLNIMQRAADEGGELKGIPHIIEEKVTIHE
jgi:hypothetical protein